LITTTFKIHHLAFTKVFRRLLSVRRLIYVAYWLSFVVIRLIFCSIVLYSIVLQYFCKETIKNNRTASFIRLMVQFFDTETDTVPLNACASRTIYLPFIKVTSLCWPRDVLSFSHNIKGNHLTRRQSNDNDDAVNDVVMVVVNGRKRRYTGRRTPSRIYQHFLPGSTVLGPKGISSGSRIAQKLIG